MAKTQVDTWQRFFGPLLAADEGADAELLSGLSLKALAQASRWRQLAPVAATLKGMQRSLQRQDPRLVQNLFGCCFKNPVGLAAGFDKNAEAAGIWHHFGFGFAELGTVTALAQAGNPKPRLFRLAKEQAALNRMGFNNQGAAAVAKILERQRLDAVGHRPAILGVNLGKSKLVPLERAASDYAASLEQLAAFADYVVINVSSPNTPGLRQLQDETLLRQLVERLRCQPACPPLLVKIAPDLEDAAIAAVARLAYEEGLAGLSGVPLRARALQVLRCLRANAGPQLPLIGVGGIDSAETAWERIAAGASLVQLYTGWIYRGPELVPWILEGLQQQLDFYGLSSIQAAVGSELPWQGGEC